MNVKFYSSSKNKFSALNDVEGNLYFFTLYFTLY